MFLDEIESVAKIVKAIIKQKFVKIFVQFDSDGVSSACILLKAFIRENAKFELRVLKQLTEKEITAINASSNDFLIFADCGSGQLPLLEKILDVTNVLILDHHEPVRFAHVNLLHINPLSHGEDELSASIVCYLFAKFLNSKNVDLVDAAVIGAIGDEVDAGGKFSGLPRKILEEAESLGKVSTSKGLRLYGRFTRPIYKSLAYSFDPFIPGISGSESQAAQFLSEIGIKPKQNGDWIKLKDLSEIEQQRLASAIIVERLSGGLNAEDIFGEVYTLLGRPEELQDAREFSTVVNACGRTGNSHIAIRLLLGDYSVLENSFQVMDDYRRMLSGALNWLRENGDAIMRKPYSNFIIAREKISETIIGTVTSIGLNSKIFEPDKPVFGLAYTDGGLVKVSARAPKNFTINLRNVFEKVSKTVDGQFGGHSSAAGGYIEKEKEEEFIKTTDMVIGEMIASKES